MVAIQGPAPGSEPGPPFNGDAEFFKVVSIATPEAVSMSDSSTVMSKSDAFVVPTDSARTEPDFTRIQQDSTGAELDYARTEHDSARTEPDSAETEPDSARTIPDSTRIEPDSAGKPDAAAALAPADAAADPVAASLTFGACSSVLRREFSCALRDPDSTSIECSPDSARTRDVSAQLAAAAAAAVHWPNTAHAT